MGSECTKTPKSVKEQIVELRKRLHEVEMADAVEEAGVIMTNVGATKSGSESKLGPTVFAEITVNGTPVNALVDTGSLATIVSLDFVLGVLAKERREGQTPTEWKAETLKRFSPPEVNLNSYGGHRLDVIAQIPLRLAQGEAHANAVVLVQKGAPNDLLLGTDVQPHLGFAIVVDRSGSKLDLLSGREWGVGGKPQRAMDTVH